MFEKHEKWIVLAVIALAIYYLFKRYGTSSSGPVGVSNFFDGSIVNPTQEPGNILPAQSTLPVLYRPAQPSTVPLSQRVAAGIFDYSPVAPVLRYNSAAPISRPMASSVSYVTSNFDPYRGLR